MEPVFITSVASASYRKAHLHHLGFSRSRFILRQFCISFWSGMSPGFSAGDGRLTAPVVSQSAVSSAMSIPSLR